MNAFSRFRFYHWLLAGLFIAAYLTGDDAGLLHLWLGYGLIAVLLWRVLAVLLRLRGYPAMLPGRHDWALPAGQAWSRLLIVGIVLTLVGALYTGIQMVDNAQALQQGLGSIVPSARADDGEAGESGVSTLLGDSEELHELLANGSLVLIGLHLGWLMLYRRRQAFAMVGLTADTPAANPAADKQQGNMTLPVVAIDAATPDVRRIVLAIPPALRSRLAFRPGQYLTLRLPLPDGAIWRSYSLCEPENGDTLTIAVKRVADGVGSGWLHTQLRCGDQLSVLPPAGHFTPASADQDLLLIGAGVGITPLYSMLQHALQHGSGQVTLVYANRSRQHTLFHDELLALQARYPQRLTLCLHDNSQLGPLSAALLQRYCQPVLGRHTYLCGPGGFMQLAEQCLLAQGQPAARLHQERFTAAAVADSPRTGASSLQVRLHDRQQQVTVDAGEVLLNAMERAGLQPPHQCRTGLCGRCRCKVDDGQVTLRNNHVLSDSELAAGWTLACQAQAASPVLSISYPDTATRQP